MPVLECPRFGEWGGPDGELFFLAGGLDASAGLD